MILLDGRALSKKRNEELAKKIESLEEKPHLAVILVGEDPASMVYVGHKEKACKAVGMKSSIHRLPASASQSDVEAKITELNNEPGVHGILLQLPLPAGLDSFSAMEKIHPSKDADCLGSKNQGLLALGKPGVKPCTPAGVIELLKSKNISLEGKHAVVIGRSNIVGKPMAQLLLAENASVSICHSKTKNLRDFTIQADIVVAAAGIPQLLGADDIKEGAVVVDVGIHRTENGLVGDVNPSGMEGKAHALSPVPGGVGPMTIAGLLQNTMHLFYARSKP